MNLFIVSDLHISSASDPLYQSLLDLIRGRVQSGDILVLAGDLFDLFVGNKGVFLQRYREFLSALDEAGSRGVQIHYIEGNHDFLIRKAFAAVPGMRVHPDEVQIEVQGKRFFIAHGDTVDRSDISYRILRLFFRSPVMRFLVNVVPGSWLDQIGRKSSGQSRKSKPLLPTALPQGRMEALRRVYRSYAAEKLAQGYDFVVLGHCHDLDEMFFSVGDRRGQYVNVGFPRVHGSVLSWSPGEEKIQREKF